MPASELSGGAPPLDPEVFSSSRFVRTLLAGTLILNLLVAGFAAKVLYDHYGEYEKRAFVASENLAEVLATDFGASLDKIDLAIAAVRDEVERQLAAGERKPRLLGEYIARQAARQPTLDALRMTNAAGDIILGTGVTPGPASFNTAQRDYFARLRDAQADELVVSAPHVGQISGKWSIVLARRIRAPDGAFHAIVFAVLHIDSLQKRFAALNLGRHGVVSLLDLQLGTVARYPDLTKGASASGSRVFSDAWAGKVKINPDFGSYFAVGLDGLNRALSYRRVAGQPFYIIVGQYPGDYLGNWNREVQGTLLIVGAFTLVTGLLAWLLRSSWRRREADARLRAAERERLMFELHDGCIQSIYGIGLALEGARQPGQAPQRTAQIVADATANLNLVIQDLRRFIAGEPPPSYTEGAILRELEAMVPAPGGGRPQFSLEIERGALRSLTEDQALHVLRIVREGVSNVLRHAQAGRVRLSLRSEREAIRLELVDDGVGMAPPDASSRGLGLHHMRARARKLGGEARFEPALRGGTRVLVEFPKAA